MSSPLLSASRPWDAEFTEDTGRGRVALAAFFLGAVFGCARSAARPPAAANTATHGLPLTAGSLLMLAVISSAAPFFAYMAMLSAFHMCEYLLTAAFRPDTLNFDNFLLNHSTVYQVMISLSWVEYWLEYGLAPSRKCWGTISTAGLLLSLLGLGTRIIAMSTACVPLPSPPRSCHASARSEAAAT